MKRKIMGGGMRQVGILAAAGILALTEQTKCLEEDHALAKELAGALADIPGVFVKPEEVDINMVFFTWPPAVNEKIAAGIVEVFKSCGILINSPERGRFRFAVHYWIREAEIQAILKASREAFAEAA
jgi:threonine aldolase